MSKVNITKKVVEQGKKTFQKKGPFPQRPNTGTTPQPQNTNTQNPKFQNQNQFQNQNNNNRFQNQNQNQNRFNNSSNYQNQNNPRFVKNSKFPVSNFHNKFRGQQAPENRVLKPYVFENEVYPYKMPQLPYKLDALDPLFDMECMQVHKNQYHNNYVENLNNLIYKHKELQDHKLETLMYETMYIDDKVNTKIKNFSGGHFNHLMFWHQFSKTPLKELPKNTKFEKSVKDSFSSLETLKENLQKQYNLHEGSGWTWLALDNTNKLQVMNTGNNLNPLTTGLRPLLALDAWEHTYYLNYGADKHLFLENLWEFFDWNRVNKVYDKALKW